MDYISGILFLLGMFFGGFLMFVFLTLKKYTRTVSTSYYVYEEEIETETETEVEYDEEYWWNNGKKPKFDD